MGREKIEDKLCNCNGHLFLLLLFCFIFFVFFSFGGCGFSIADAFCYLLREDRETRSQGIDCTARYSIFGKMEIRSGWQKFSDQR